MALWNKFKNNSKVKYDRGLAKFKDLFTRIKNIRKWDITDRIKETGLVEDWEIQLAENPSQPVRFEVELWFFNNPEKREASENSIKDLITNNGGAIISRFISEEIGYHAILASLPASKISEIINNPATSLLRADDVMFFRPAGQVSAICSIEDSATSMLDGVPESTPSEIPVAALLDGYPLANHKILLNRISIDDPDEFSTAYTSPSMQLHGSAMASLVIAGDLNQSNQYIKSKLYVRPIMKPKALMGDRSKEFIPENILTVDLVFRSIKRIFEPTHDTPPVAPSVKLISLSIGDSSRPFLGSMSPFAKAIDWLSYKYNVLFIISAGNCTNSIKPNLSRDDFHRLTDIQKASKIVEVIRSDERNRKIISPAESLNSITVGAIHSDGYTQSFALPNYHINPFDGNFPSPLTTIGCGYKGAIKPDISYPAGRVLFLESPLTTSDQYSLSIQELLGPHA